MSIRFTDGTPPDGIEMAEMHRRVLRPPVEGTMAAAITSHAQACGLVAYAFNVHPDDVARAVAHAA